MEPEVLVLDEPTSGLDPVGQVEIRRRLKQLHQEKGLTIVFVTHNMEEVLELSDRLVVLDQGRLILDDSPRRIFSQAARLIEIGLDIPQIPALLRALRSRGIDLPHEIFRVEEAERAILAYFKGRLAWSS